MRREAFLDFLVSDYRGPRTNRPLMDDSAKSYCANLARAEETLRINFDNVDLSPVGQDQLDRRLRASRLSGPKVGDCMSAIRAYAQFLAGRPSGGAGRPTSAARPRQATSPPRPPKLAASLPRAPDPLIGHMSVKGLLAMHGAVMDELKARGVVRTSNAPGGDYAETLFARAFGWTLATNSALGYDAVDADGVRYQIKSRRVTGQIGERQLSAIRRLPEKAFDHLAAVLFDGSYGVMRAIILPHHLIEPRASFRPHVNGWLLQLDDRVWDLAGARDVTAELVAAAETM